LAQVDNFKKAFSVNGRECNAPCSLLYNYIPLSYLELECHQGSLLEDIWQKIYAQLPEYKKCTRDCWNKSIDPNSFTVYWEKDRKSSILK